MKAHISRKMIEAGGAPLCSSTNRLTSGYSTTLTEWRTLDWQCARCKVALEKMEAKRAARSCA